MYSTEEYQHWVKAYVRFLSEHNDIARLRPLMAELLGGSRGVSVGEENGGQGDGDSIAMASRAFRGPGVVGMVLPILGMTMA